MLDQAFKSSQFVSYKCHAQLYSFAAPIKVNNVPTFVVLGGRIFRSYQDFSAFSKMAHKLQIKDYFFEEWEYFLRIWSSQHFERAARVIQSMVDAIYKDSAGANKSHKRVDHVGTLYEVVRSLTDTPLDKIAEVVLQAVSVLFDISEGAIWQCGS